MSNTQFAYLTIERPSTFSSRVGVVIAVIALHVAFVLALTYSARVRLVDSVIEPLQVMLLSESTNHAPSPSVPAPHIEMPQVDVTALRPLSIEIPISAPASTNASDSSAITVAVVTPAPIVPVTAPITVNQVEYLHAPVLVYPPLSKKLREQGKVILRVLIDEQGRAADIQVQSSSGYARLDSAAQQAVRLAEFKPYQTGGVTHRVYVTIPLEFALKY
jgi:protein TonB